MGRARVISFRFCLGTCSLPCLPERRPCSMFLTWLGLELGLGLGLELGLGLGLGLGLELGLGLGLGSGWRWG